MASTIMPAVTSDGTTSISAEIQCPLDISRVFPPKKSEKDTPYFACKGEVWGVFCDFVVWLKVKLLFVHFVLNIVLYSTAIYRDSMAVGCITVYPKKYAHGFCFAVLCCGYTLTDFPISIRLTSLALWQSKDCPSATKATLMNMDK